jgi:hypothetical protein
MDTDSLIDDGYIIAGGSLIAMIITDPSVTSALAGLAGALVVALARHLAHRLRPPPGPPSAPGGDP